MKSPTTPRLLVLDTFDAELHERLNQVLHHATMSATPYVNEIKSDSQGHENRTFTSHSMTAGDKIRFLL